MKKMNNQFEVGQKQCPSFFWIIINGTLDLKNDTNLKIVTNDLPILGRSIDLAIWGKSKRWKKSRRFYLYSNKNRRMLRRRIVAEKIYAFPSHPSFKFLLHNSVCSELVEYDFIILFDPRLLTTSLRNDCICLLAVAPLWHMD